MHITFIHHAHHIHTPCTSHSYTMHITFVHHAHHIHTPCTSHSHTMHITFIHHAHHIHTPCTSHSYTMHITFIYHAHHILHQSQSHSLSANHCHFLCHHLIISKSCIPPVHVIQLFFSHPQRRIWKCGSRWKVRASGASGRSWSFKWEFEWQTRDHHCDKRSSKWDSVQWHAYGRRIS